MHMTVVCIRKEELPIPSLPSDTGICIHCKAAVWISKVISHLGHEMEVTCNKCFRLGEDT